MLVNALWRICVNFVAGRSEKITHFAVSMSEGRSSSEDRPVQILITETSANFASWMAPLLSVLRSLLPL